MNTKLLEDARALLLEQRSVIDQAVTGLETIIQMNGRATIAAIPLLAAEARKEIKPKRTYKKRKAVLRSPSPRPAPRGEGDRSPAVGKPMRPSNFNITQSSHKTAGKLIVAMRAVAAVMKTFTREQLKAAIELRDPEIEGKQLYNIGANLMLMLERGELTRKGTGSAAVWSVAKLKAVPESAPAPKTNNVEEKYRELRDTIHVPRDLDDGQDRD